MPTRIIREGIISSEPVNRLSPSAELFYRRLMTVADDYGRYYAHADLLRGACYPLQIDRVSSKDIVKWMVECVRERLIIAYGNGKYLQIVKFGQQCRSKSKFPEPTDSELLSNCTSIDKQEITDSYKGRLAPDPTPTPNTDPLGGCGGNGGMGGNPALLNQNPTTGVKQIPTPSSSSSTSSSEVLNRDFPGEPEKEKEYHIHARAALFYLNEKAGRHFRETDVNLAKISARLKEPGVTIESVKEMIDHQWLAWAADPKMSEFLRPDTLFGKEKFDQYHGNRKAKVNPRPNGHARPTPDNPYAGMTGDEEIRLRLKNGDL